MVAALAFGACLVVPVRPAAAVGPVCIASPDDDLLLSSRLVFSTVNEEPRPARSFAVCNPGATDVTVTSLTITGAQAGSFSLEAGQPTSFTVPAGGSAPVAVEFHPAGPLLHVATLTVATVADGTAAVLLRGLDSMDYEGTHEPKLSVILTALGYTTSVPTTRVVGTTRLPVGDEIVSPYWKAADTTKPVTLMSLARYAFRMPEAGAITGWGPEGFAERTTLFSFPGGTDPSAGENQRLLPTPDAASPASFSPPGTFGLWACDKVGGKCSDSVDDPNGVGHVHAIRFFPAKGPAGPIPDAWLVAWDIGNTLHKTPQGGWDYNDSVYLMTNAMPALDAASLPGDTSLTLDFGSARPGTIADRDDEGTGFAGVLASGLGTEYVPSKLDLVTSPGQLTVQTTVGTFTGAQQSQRNALNSPFDGTRSVWQTEVRVPGPITSLTLPRQQQAVFVAIDRDSYFKAEVEASASGPSLIAFYEQAGTGKIVAGPVPLVSPETIATLDLGIIGNPADGTLTMVYRIDSDSPAAWTVFGSPTKLPNPMAWFSRQSHAGLLASNQGTPTSFTAVYDSFAVKPL